MTATRPSFVLSTLFVFVAAALVAVAASPILQTAAAVIA